jgi:hypothetical protein
MKKYYLGLLVISLVVLGLAGYTINLGAQSKQDKVTYEKAKDVSEALNEYIENEGEIPENLESLETEDIPSTIKYKKVSSTEYELCLTYKADKSYGGSDITSVLTGAALGGMYGDFDMSDYEADYKSSYLYINPYYSKGENCQTIEPYLGLSSNIELDSGDEYKTYCTGDYQAYFKEYCESLEASEDSNSSFDSEEL